MNYHVVKTSIDASPYSIACDENGIIFVTENKGNCIGIIQNGKLTEYPLPTENAGVRVITTHKQQAWFTMYDADKIGRITADGVIHEIDVETGSQPFGIAADEKGRIWFTCMGNHTIGCYYNGEVLMFPIPTKNCFPSFITCTAKGHLWFCENQGNRIAHMTADGVIVEYELPNAASAPVGIAACSEGAVFVEIMGNRIGHIEPSGKIIEYPIETPDAKPHAIIASTDRDYWVSLWGANKLAHFSVDGTIHEYEIPLPSAEPHGICVDPQGRIWAALENQGVLCLEI